MWNLAFLDAKFGILKTSVLVLVMFVFIFYILQTIVKHKSNQIVFIVHVELQLLDKKLIRNYFD